MKDARDGTRLPCNESVVTLIMIFFNVLIRVAILVVLLNAHFDVSRGRDCKVQIVLLDSPSNCHEDLLSIVPICVSYWFYMKMRINHNL
jgi:hypothetical protein